MPRLGLGLGLNLPRPIFLGGGGSTQPPMPIGSIGDWIAYEATNFNFVNGDQTEDWLGSNGTSNTLTQTTSASQPTLSEDGVVTQFTVSQQPTLVDTGGGVLAVAFDTTDYLSSNVLTSGYFTARTSINIPVLNAENRILSTVGSNTARFYISASGTVWVRSNEGNQYSLTFGSLKILPNTDHSIILQHTESGTSIYIDGVIGVNGVVDTGLDTFTYNSLGEDSSSLDGFMYSFEYFDTPVANPTNITETPTFILLPTVDSIPTGVGAQMPKWYSQEANQYLARVNTTAVQFMSDYPEVIGDVTHLRAISYDVLGTIKKDYSHSTGSAWLGANASDRYEAVSDLGTSFVFSTLAVTLDHNQTAWVVRGTNLELWYFGNLIESKDITGETFTLDRYGASANSATGGTEWKHIYPSALTASDIEWFSYLRNQDTNEILLPPMWPDPITPI